MEKDNKIKSFIDEVSVFSDGKLKNIDDLELLITLVEEEGKQNEFLELIFFAKFVIKLYRILKKGGSEETEKIKEEFLTHAEKVKELLRLLVKDDENSYTIYNDKYFGNTPEAFDKLMDLLNDLAWIKNWHLDKKTLW
jgi:hypothetical protein